MAFPWIRSEKVPGEHSQRLGPYLTLSILELGIDSKCIHIIASGQFFVSPVSVSVSVSSNHLHTELSISIQVRVRASY